LRLRREDRSGRRRVAEVAIHEGKSHPRVGGGGAVNCPPGREGRQGLLRAGSFPPRQQVTGGNDLTVGARAQSPLDEGVQVSEVGHHLQAGLRDQDVG
jgi:hypothetical protein